MGFKKINAQYEIEKRIKDDEELKECLRGGFMSKEDINISLCNIISKLDNIDTQQIEIFGRLDKIDIKLYEMNSKLDKFDAILSHVFVKKKAEEIISTDDDKNNKIAQLTKDMEDLQKQADGIMSKKVKLREELNKLLK
jgi:hypothetical protein